MVRQKSIESKKYKKVNNLLAIIAVVGIGAHFINSCPAGKNIPILLIVTGSFWVVEHIVDVIGSRVKIGKTFWKILDFIYLS